MVDIKEMWFDPDDDLTTCVLFEPSEITLNGYLDINEEQYYLDDEESFQRATFTTPTINNYSALAGNRTSINSVNYRVNAITPDGTGVMSIALMRA